LTCNLRPCGTAAAEKEERSKRHSVWRYCLTGIHVRYRESGWDIGRQ
jgi:hypothetical protein